MFLTILRAMQSKNLVTSHDFLNERIMKTILILGAGLSSSSMIRYLLNEAANMHWQIRIVDQNLEMVRRKINGNPAGVALSFNALNRDERLPELEKADLVISMLPARFHIEIAQDCIALKKNLITPSYVSPEMKALDSAAREAGIVIVNEIGVDPGIDHMSACKILDEIQEKGGEIHSFKSYCGGLIAPESDNNPWNYKFTWNPRNVVIAGQGGAAKFIQENQYKYIPYHNLFQRLDRIEIAGYGAFEGYANRDSLSYRSVYKLDNIPTIYRGTLRRVGFSEAWNIFVNLGMTDDSYTLEDSANMTPRTFLNTFLPFFESESVEEKFIRLCAPNRPDLFEKIEWLGFFDDTKTFGVQNATPAQLLEMILVAKWTLQPNDKDMLVMYHDFSYNLHGKRQQVTSSMVNIGEDPVYTAMSNTVGLPVAICAKLILTNVLPEKGIVIPVEKSIYEPILTELESLGIVFTENWSE